MKQTHAEAPLLLRKIVAGLIRHRLPCLLLCLLLTALAFTPSRRLGFDRTIEGLFLPDDPRLIHYLEDQRLFGQTETALVAYSDENLLTREGIDRLASFAAELRNVNGVESVLSLADSKLPGSPLSALTIQQHLAAGRIPEQTIHTEILSSDLYRGRLVSPDGLTALLLVSLASNDEKPGTRKATFREIRTVCESHTPPAVLAGSSVLIETVYTQLEQDGRMLGTISSLVLAGVIALLFRSLRWVLLPLAVVHVTLIWTKAILVISETKLSMVSSPLVALVTVIGVATVVHVMIRFREERTRLAPEEALRETLIHVGPAVFWTCLTTMGGFSALMACRIAPVAGFGMMMALGSGLVFVAALLILPAGLLLGKVHLDASHIPGEKSLIAGLDRIVSAAERHPKQVVLGGCLILAFTAFGVTRLKIATAFDENFRSSSPIVVSYSFLSERMETVGTHDVLIDAPETDNLKALDGFLTDVRALQTDLENLDGVTGTSSVADILEFVMGTRRERAGMMELATAGMLASMSPAERLTILQSLQPELIGGFWNRDQNVMRIIVQTGRSRGADSRRNLFDDVKSLSASRFPSARIAGVDILLSHMVASLLSDQWLTFGLAVLAIVVMVTIAFRDWRLGLMALIPNAVPIVVVIGTMGWFGIKVDMASAMLASVSMGLAVDFSIHYLYRFRHELQQGRSVPEALRAAHGSVGLAMVLANSALILGFLTMVFSAFIPTIHFGVLVSITMLGSLIGNLISLPILLQFLFHRTDS